jgi:hypothetical protein
MIVGDLWAQSVQMGDRLQTGEPFKGLAGAAVSPVLYRIVRNWFNVYPLVRDGLGIDSPRMGPGRPMPDQIPGVEECDHSMSLLEIGINLWNYRVLFGSGLIPISLNKKALLFKKTFFTKINDIESTPPK